MKQGKLFDPVLAEEKKGVALLKVERGANSEWKAAAFLAVQKTARLSTSFTADDVWENLPAGYSTKDKRAMGPVMKRAQGAGLISPTSHFVKSRRVTCHQMPRRVWKSEICE